MSENEIYFRGFLTNADASILQLSFDHGFKIRALSQDEATGFIMAIEKVPKQEAIRTLFMKYPCMHALEENRIYVIDNTVKMDADIKEVARFNRMAGFSNEMVENYLNCAIRLMRLFREGDLRMPLQYYYAIKNGKPASFMSLKSGRHISTGSYHLESSELEELRRFLHDTRIPFDRAFLELAFENFELSYEIPNIGLSFLTLMISLEALFNPGESELKHRISRNAAVLLGHNKEESEMMFLEVKSLYDKRSRIAHTGESKGISTDDLLRLRHYVRESIKKLHRIGKSKDEILKLLDSHGFGEKLPL